MLGAILIVDAVGTAVVSSVVVATCVVGSVVGVTSVVGVIIAGGMVGYVL